jgi:hypothetical protein
MSKYVVIKTGDPVRGEHTNIGVIVFDDDGNQHSYRLDDLARAKARGDYPAADPGEWISRWAESLSLFAYACGFTTGVLAAHAWHEHRADELAGQALRDDEAD